MCMQKRKGNKDNECRVHEDGNCDNCRHDGKCPLQDVYHTYLCFKKNKQNKEIIK